MLKNHAAQPSRSASGAGAERSASALASALAQQFGVRKGDRVAIIRVISHEFLEVYFAAAALGAAEVVMGPPRHLDLPPGVAAERIPWPVPFADGRPILDGLRCRARPKHDVRGRRRTVGDGHLANGGEVSIRGKGHGCLPRPCLDRELAATVGRCGGAVDLHRDVRERALCCFHSTEKAGRQGVFAATTVVTARSPSTTGALPDLDFTA